MWFSRDGLPEKHQARLIQFQLLNPSVVIRVIYAPEYLTSAGTDALLAFAHKSKIILIDHNTIQPRTPDEVAIKEHINRELRYFFSAETPQQHKGNLSVVADQLRCFEQVLEWGVVSDFDVIFGEPLPLSPVFSRLGFTAKTRLGIEGYAGGVRISNDMLAGLPQHPVFLTVRKLTAAFNEYYHNALPQYFRENGIDFDPENYGNHPAYFEPRNQALSEFSLGGGPQLWAIALDKHGFPTGYENIAQPEVFELGENLCFSPYLFREKSKLFATFLPLILDTDIQRSLSAEWDHSWQVSQTNWRVLNRYEQGLLACVEAYFSGAAALELIRPSQWLNYFSYLINPSPIGRRHREFTELTSAEQAYVLETETPDLSVRQALSAKLGATFQALGEQFVREGVLILPGFFDPEEVAAFQAVFNAEISKKTPHPFLRQAAFNAAVDSDGVEDASAKTIFSMSKNPNLQALIQYHFGKKSKLAAMRGYRQLPTQSVKYRAWDYHQDLKTKGPYGEIKMMILVNGVTPEGQAMRLMKGTHQYHWHSAVQAQTKYSIEECLAYSTHHTATICAGPPGTVILFDTNVLHSGHRNDHSIRDIFTVSYTPDAKDAPVMSARFETEREATACLDFTPNPEFWNKLVVDSTSLTPEETEHLKEEYEQTPSIEELKDRFNSSGTVDFKTHLLSAISIDLNADLNLRLNTGRTDTIRDNQLIAFRDVPPEHTQFQRLATKMAHFHIELNASCDILKMHDYACLASQYSTHENRSISHCAIFAADLAEALLRIDNRQILRTTLAYLYFTLDHLIATLEIPPLALTQAAETVLKTYINVLYFDDLEFQLSDRKKIPCVGESQTPFQRAMHARRCQAITAPQAGAGAGTG
jgi:hypothetical protein